MVFFNICCGLALSLLIGISNAIIETLAYSVFQFLESKNIMKRFAPHVKRTMEHYQWRTFMCVTINWFPWGFIGSFYLDTILAKVQFSFNPLYIWWAVFTDMVLHDIWFYVVHSLLHANKSMYMKMHFTHHSGFADLNAFGTIYGEVSEVFFIFVSFHVLQLVYVFSRESWNPAVVAAIFLIETLTNMGGHSGYDLPSWFWGLTTLGICILPYGVTSKSHYIHHINPRYNRALYFTFWDRLFGSYRHTHPLTDPPAIKCQKAEVPNVTHLLACS